MHRHLEQLADEGLPALEKTLHRDPLVRGFSMAAPSLAAYLLSLPVGSLEANSVAFASLVSANLLMTLDSAVSKRYLRWQLLAAVGGSAVLLGAFLAVPGVGGVFTLSLPTPQGMGLIAASAATSAVLRRLIDAGLELPAALRARGALPEALPAALLPAP
jgi:hypothetical protein